LITGWEKTPTDVEYITLTTMGTDTTILKEFVDAAIVHNMAKDQDTIGIYELHRWGIGWTKVQSKKPRLLESVILDRNLSEEIIADMQRF